MIGASLLLVALSLDGSLSRFEAAFLLLLLIAYTVFLVLQSRAETQAARDEYAACSELIRDVTGQTPRFCRPPGGRTNAAVERAGREAGLQTVYWTVNSRDYTDLPPEVIARKVAGLVRPGGVVLLHDGVTATIEALPAIIRDLRNRGYRFVTLDELFSPPENRKAGIRRRGGSDS